MKLREFIKEFELRYPPQWAMESDKVGLFCGDLNRGVEKILVALDPSKNVLEEAASGGYDLLLTHHPVYRSDFKNITAQDGASGKLFFAIQHDIAIYSAHTNLDFAPDGVSVALAKMLDVEIEDFLHKKSAEKLYKLVVFVPRKDFENFRKSMLNTGIGCIGKYSHSSFSSSGEGTFFPLDGASPYLGQVGKLEKTEEMRFETVVPAHLLKSAVEAIHTYHPYEEPAFDIYPLANDRINGGFGVVGLFEKTLKLEDVVERCRSKLITNVVRYSGNSGEFVRRVALIGGTGDSLVGDVISAKADVFIAGELGHHSIMDLKEAGICAVVPGHFATEWVILPHIRDVVEEILKKFEVAGKVDLSEVEEPIFKV